MVDWGCFEWTYRRPCPVIATDLIFSGIADLTSAQKLAVWKTRKQACLQRLRDKPPITPSLLVSACDKLQNARAILADFRPAVVRRQW